MQRPVVVCSSFLLKLFDELNVELSVRNILRLPCLLKVRRFEEDS